MNYMAEGFEFVYDTELFGLQSRIQKEVNLGTRTPEVTHAKWRARSGQMVCIE